VFQKELTEELPKRIQTESSRRGYQERDSQRDTRRWITTKGYTQGFTPRWIFTTLKSYRSEGINKTQEFTNTGV